MNTTGVILFLALITMPNETSPEISQGAYITPSILNANPQKYDGREVLVRGYVVLGNQARLLYESKELNEEFRREWERNSADFEPSDYHKYCLTLLNAKFLLDNREIFNGQTIEIRGTFEMNYNTDDVLDLQSCALPSALILDDEDVQRVYRSLIH